MNSPNTYNYEGYELVRVRSRADVINISKSVPGEVALRVAGVIFSGRRSENARGKWGIHIVDFANLKMAKRSLLLHGTKRYVFDTKFLPIPSAPRGAIINGVLINFDKELVLTVAISGVIHSYTFSEELHRVIPMMNTASFPLEVSLGEVGGAVSTGQCANCGSTTHLKECMRCKAVVYCSKECQKAHWKAENGHKSTCNVIFEAMSSAHSSV